MAPNTPSTPSPSKTTSSNSSRTNKATTSGLDSIDAAHSYESNNAICIIVACLVRTLPSTKGFESTLNFSSLSGAYWPNRMNNRLALYRVTSLYQDLSPVRSAARGSASNAPSAHFLHEEHLGLAPQRLRQSGRGFDHWMRLFESNPTTKSSFLRRHRCGVNPAPKTTPPHFTASQGTSWSKAPREASGGARLTQPDHR